MSSSFAFLSTYPPTPCGLATFTEALRGAIADLGHATGVVRLAPQAARGNVPRHVVATIANDRVGDAAAAAAALDGFDVAIVQHEFGIFGGVDGSDAVAILDLVTVPVVVVAHTVLEQPTWHQRQLLEAVARRADSIVTMTETARRRLLSHYDVAPEKVVVVPHGATDGVSAPTPSGRDRYLLTWGLLGPGKGIERVIAALPALRETAPDLTYLIVGQTHPHVLDHEGERYRESLAALATQLGVDDMVEFVDEYLDGPTIRAIAAAAEVVVLPYDSHEQVTSGVLIEAVVACRPIVATAFAHATELLATGAGIVVEHDDPEALVAAVRAICAEPTRAAAMVVAAQRLAPTLLWPAVARGYVTVAERLLAATTAAA